MASEYRINRPYVLATLPKPLDHTQGNIVAREVYGQRDGQKKKKRNELVVGVDGEFASIYDVPASRLITSYPIPPQESFCCPPYSTRIRNSTTKEILRYTYIVTGENTSQKISLFKDTVLADGKTISTTLTNQLSSSPVEYITSWSASSHPSTASDILLVCEGGELLSLSGETLAVQWTSSTLAAVQDVVSDTLKNPKVLYATSGSMSDFTNGMFKHKPEVYSAFPKSVESEPELVAVVIQSAAQERMHCHLVVMAAFSASTSTRLGAQTCTPLDIAPVFTTTRTDESKAIYQVDIQAGVLFELQDGILSVYDLTGAVPKVKSKFDAEGSSSFTRLAKPFVLAASLTSISLHNYQYRSLHAKAALDLTNLPSELQFPQSFNFISHIRSQNLIVALIDHTLVSIHIEPPKQHGKRRKEGLLIDSIGRGTASELPAKRSRCDDALEFSRQVPGTMTESYLEGFRLQTQTADELLGSNELGKWEELLQKKFHMRPKKQLNGNAVETGQELPEWVWGTSSSKYPSVDRRWVIYALSQVFSVRVAETEEPRAVLQLTLAESNVLTYLVVAGHITLSNLKSAFAEELNRLEDKVLAGDLVTCLTSADPSMGLLLNYLQATKLGEVEIILAIRALMLSMDFIPDTEKLNSTKLLSNEAHESSEGYDMDLDDLEREIALTEQYLGDDASSRSRGLTLAFTKLWRLPAINTIKALRSTIRTEEILSFIYLLRMELVRGAWTTLYVDATSFEAEGNDPPPDGVITLIADLLSRCLDAIGAGGWLFNDAMAWANKAEAGDFLTALRLEVSAALEGIGEAVYLGGFVSEAVRYGYAAQKSGALRQQGRNANVTQPVTMQLEEGRESREMLPLGLKVKQLPTKEKVVSGGELVQRSARETGHLISQKVEAYSLERLTI